MQHGQSKDEWTGPGQHQAGSSHAGFRDDLVGRARRMANERKQELVNRLEGVANALQRTGEGLKSDGDEHVARLAEGAARKVQSFSRTISEREPDDVVEEVQRFARAQPLLFAGCAFAGGLLVGRLLRVAGSEEHGSLAGSEELGSVGGGEQVGPTGPSTSPSSSARGDGWSGNGEQRRSS